MARKYLFIDESGNLDFSGKASASSYFILTSVLSDTYEPAVELLRLRHDLVIEGGYDNHCFHATEDRQAIRDRVFACIQRLDLRVDATIFQKSRILPHLRTDGLFYEFAWYLHLKHILPRVVSHGDDLIIFAATLQTSAKKSDFATALHGTLTKLEGRSGTTRLVLWPAQCEHGIQIADYCAWAIQRKWERGDLRSYEIIQHLMASEFEMLENVDGVGH